MKPRDYVIYSKKVEDNSALIQVLSHRLKEHGFTENAVSPSLILVLGGDGSLMRAFHEYRGKGDYLLFNTGHLGFYADYGKDEFDDFLNDIVSKEEEIEPLPCYTFALDGVEHHFVNDVAIQSGETCFLEIYVNDELLTESRSNGIVVSSPIGTTGYLTSLGSPVVIGKPDLYQYALLSPCFNRMFPNSISKAIMEGKDVLRVEIKEGFADIYIDGGRKTDFHGTSFTFTHKNDEHIRLVHLKHSSYVARLRKNISGKD